MGRLLCLANLGSSLGRHSNLGQQSELASHWHVIGMLLARQLELNAHSDACPIRAERKGGSVGANSTDRRIAIKKLAFFELWHLAIFRFSLHW